MITFGWHPVQGENLSSSLAQSSTHFVCVVACFMTVLTDYFYWSILHFTLVSSVGYQKTESLVFLSSAVWIKDNWTNKLMIIRFFVFVIEKCCSYWFIYWQNFMWRGSYLGFTICYVCVFLCDCISFKFIYVLADLDTDWAMLSTSVIYIYGHTWLSLYVHCMVPKISPGWMRRDVVSMVTL